jgi:DNA-binding protein HU-beta
LSLQHKVFIITLEIQILGGFPMKKTELVAAIAASAKLSKKDAEAALNAFVASVTKALRKGEKVTLTGFGTFETRKRAAREGRNPRTGAKIKIAAQKSPAFKAGKALKDAVK